MASPALNKLVVLMYVPCLTRLISVSWRAVRLRKLAAMFGDIVKAHRKMEEEEAARRAAHEAKALVGTHAISICLGTFAQSANSHLHQSEFGLGIGRQTSKSEDGAITN